MINEHSKFFRMVWRFNALVIAGAAILSIILGTIGVASLLVVAMRERNATNVVNVDEQAEIKNNFVPGDPYPLAGTDTLMMPLYRDQSYDIRYSVKNSNFNTVNYLFLNSRTGEKNWLVTGTNQLFVSDLGLTETLAIGKINNPIIGILYTVVEKDTNEDKRLSERDAVTIATSAPDGSGYKKLIENIDRLYAAKQIADDKIILLYEQDKETISALYEIPSMRKLSAGAIPSFSTE